MNITEICLLGLGFLYAIILYKALVNIDIVDKKIEIITRELLTDLEIIKQKHNSFVEGQDKVFKELLDEVNNRVKGVYTKQAENNTHILSEVGYLKNMLKMFFK